MALVVLVLLSVVGPAVSDKHSLYYIYTALSKDVQVPGIYEFTALGLLDDREIDYYNSKEQVKVPKQEWMKEKMQPDYWDKGTQSRKSKEQWFKVNVEILMKRMRHNETDLHVLQWRHGCEIDEADGKPKFLRGIDEYSYDGSEFLSFDDDNMRWIAPVPEALQTKRKWDDVPILNQYTKGYLEKECVDWLTKFMEYGKESLRKHSNPDVHALSKKSTTNSDKLTLTCLATGFYPKDVTLRVRKFRTSLPEHLLTSSGVRPNDDGTYQLRKSVDIQVDETAEYDCYVNHITLAEPIITKWEGPPSQGGLGLAIGGALAGVIVLAVLIGVIFFILKRRVAEPKNLKVVEVTQTSVKVQWEEPLENIDRYIISSSLSQTNGPGLNREFEVSGQNFALIDHLEPGCLYIISVVAERDKKRSSAGTVKATLFTDPKNLTVLEISTTSVKVQWEKALGEIDRYILMVSPSPANGSRQIIVPSDQDSAEINHLNPDCLYDISVVAEKGSEQSQAATVQATTVFTDPKTLTVLEISTTSVKVQWEKALGAIDRYILMVSPSPANGARQIIVPSDQDSAEINHLNPGCLYNIYVVVEKGSEQSQPATVQATTVISSPTNLEVVEITARSVKVQWKKALGEFDRYILVASLSQANELNPGQKIQVPSGENSAKIDDLDPGCSYNISVVAKKGSAQSQPATVQATTAAGSDTDSGRGSNKSSNENVSADSDASSDSASRSSGSPCDSVENVNETTTLLRSDANEVANDSPPDEKQRLLD
ncbi:hypothetical protein SRHO_G00100860 [Serrasalmus rhombeus]